MLQFSAPRTITMKEDFGEFNPADPYPAFSSLS
jgi:hypothetical protein